MRLVKTFGTKRILRELHLPALTCMRVDLNILFVNTGTCREVWNTDLGYIYHTDVMGSYLEVNTI